MATNLHTTQAFNLSAGWDVGNAGRRRCRWFVAWRQRREIVFGAVGGYAGGGAFLCEKFYGERTEEQLGRFIVGDRCVLGPEKARETLIPPEVSVACEDALDEVFLWHDQTLWEDFESLYLALGMDADLERHGDLLCLRGPNEPFVAEVCDLSGLTAAPVPFNRSR
jgi:hypothetical protein